ncbi:hypothetical protein Calab_1300 [Caldithrix abyssi DSM 13497]|uniref:Uncharacterized protein n=1 Tax=Caldithrix abyssi DSM 13497 TaxID=880073 RepID=H1XYQ6_CALAY|nr:hypothetical protein Cabys_3819 [Caldithrix abyssi DSM 13497]EHO40925.1 hypothetical protein Calab_1300 [Caldithrix abyssi DSM 13497]
MRYYFTLKRQCPKCKRNSLTRIKRLQWMRYLPNSKHYECDFCRSNIVFIDLFKKYAKEAADY